jgi:hypothetical protein
MSQIIPIPRCPISVRDATVNDIAFIDQLQKMHGHMVGFMQRKALEGKIAAGHVVIAEEPSPQPSPGVPGEGVRLGYCISQDQYGGRDDVGIVYQLNVLPLKQRNLIGATLVKHVFERAAWGCRLFSCWCAQDIQANFFWESIGFVPLAFRTGSRSMQRTHIFWQKRIREGDATTPYWFPSNTKNGLLREDRLVVPIPIGTHWRDPMPMLLPSIQVEPELPKTLPGGQPVRPRPEQPAVSTAQRIAVIRSKSKNLRGTPAGKAAVITKNGIRYVDRGDYVPEPEPPKVKKPAKPRAKHDPKQIAAARELRDKFLEHINTNPAALPDSPARYHVVKQIESPAPKSKPVQLLEAA